MQSIRTRQLTADLAYDGTKYTTAKPWRLAETSTVAGVEGGTIASQGYVMAAIAGGVHGHPSEVVVHVDSNQPANYTETGHSQNPYRTLSAAIAAKLADGETDDILFKLAPGKYVGTISRDKATAEQSFTIQGSGSKNTFISGSATWDATTGNVCYFRDFENICIKDCTFQYGQYGVYIRSAGDVNIENCEFQYLGSSGVNHELTRTQAQMAADWATKGTAGSNRSDGGAMRIRDADNVQINNCSVHLTFRGIRLQDCAGGRVTDCRVTKSLESAYYLASGSYTGDVTYGSSNFHISGCRADEIFHNGFLVIGGNNNTITNCQAINCANSAVVGFHTQNLRVLGCLFDQCTSKTYLGYGALGDALELSISPEPRQ